MIQGEGDELTGSTLGERLILEMEDFYGMERCDSDRYTIKSVYCEKCGHWEYVFTPIADVEKQCPKCGEMAAFLNDGLKE